MKRWWLRRTLKLRLALWYAATTAVALVAFAVFFYELIEHRLGGELERQLRIDFDVIEAQLELDATGQVRWLLRGAHGDAGSARLSAWFEVWAGDEALLRHWPVPDAEIHQTLPAPDTATLRFRSVELEPGLQVRLMERPARLRDRGVILRVFRDETEMRRTLRQVVEVFLLGLPVAILLAAAGGYLLARQSLAPLTAMAAQARQITSESLGERLPVPNPHDELGQLALVFNEAFGRLHRSFDELRRFTADASHELRSPLTALQTAGEVGLRGRPSEAELRDTIGSMLEDAHGLADLIDALLTLARLEGGKVELKRESLELKEVLDDLRGLLNVLAEDKQQTLAVTIEAGLRVRADRVLLRQALINIVHNAIRYSPTQTRIELRGRTHDGSISIEVSDQGPGMAAEHRAKVFERFFRIDQGRSRDDGGTGLGLAIAKWSVELQGGKIEVESELGRGSVFRILLPPS